MSDDPKLSLILHRDADQKFKLWACRGEGKGCARNKYRSRLKPCDDCFGPLPENLTLGQVVERLKQGDA